VFGRRTAQDEREMLGISIAMSMQIESTDLNSSKREEWLSVRLKEMIFFFLDGGGQIKTK